MDHTQNYILTQAFPRFNCFCRGIFSWPEEQKLRQSLVPLIRILPGHPSLTDSWSPPHLTKDTEAEERGVIYPQSDATLSPPGAQALEGGAIGGGGWVLPRMSPGLCVRH